MRIENRTAMVYINRQGLAHTTTLLKLVEDVWLRASEHQLSLKALHILGLENRSTLGVDAFAHVPTFEKTPVCLPATLPRPSLVGESEAGALVGNSGGSGLPIGPVLTHT